MPEEPVRGPVVLDANILLNACFVPESWSMLCIVKMRRSREQLVTSSLILAEAEHVLWKLLDGSPTKYLDECVARLRYFVENNSISVLFVGNKRSVGPLDHHDEHVLVAADQAQGTILTSDVGFWAKLQAASCPGLLPLELLYRYDPLMFAVQFIGVRPTPSSGSVFCRVRPGGWAGQQCTGRRTVFFAGNEFNLYYDQGRESWVCRFGTAHELVVAVPLSNTMNATVAISWEKGGRIIMREGSKNLSNSIPLASDLSANFHIPVQVGSTRHLSNHWNGSIQSIIWNDRPIGKNVWKECRNADTFVTPNPFDHDRLQAAVIGYLKSVFT